MIAELTWRQADVSPFIDYEREGYKLVTRNHGKLMAIGIFTYKSERNGYSYTVEEHYALETVDRHITICGFECHIGRVAILRSLWWSKLCKGGVFLHHRDDGPAGIVFDYKGIPIWERASWFINGRDITKDVAEWSNDMDLPPFYQWNDGHKALFKITFG